MENQFELRRKEYENMTKKTVPTPTFKENVKDEAIGDIGSAVNEYMKQRDLDAKMFAPKEPLAPVKDSALKTDISIEIEEIDNNFSAKKVKWGENTEHFYKENDKMHDIFEMLGTLTKKIDEHALKRPSSTMTDTIRRCMKIGHALQACGTWRHRGGG